MHHIVLAPAPYLFGKTIYTAHTHQSPIDRSFFCGRTQSPACPATAMTRASPAQQAHGQPAAMFQNSGPPVSLALPAGLRRGQGPLQANSAQVRHVCSVCVLALALVRLRLCRVRLRVRVRVCARACVCVRACGHACVRSHRCMCTQTCLPVYCADRPEQAPSLCVNALQIPAVLAPSRTVCDIVYGESPCQACAAGTWSAGGNLSKPNPKCMACASGSTTLLVGSTAAADCTCDNYLNLLLSATSWVPCLVRSEPHRCKCRFAYQR